MKKNLLLFICLLIAVSIPAQEVSHNLNLKSLQQGFNAQTVPSNRAYSTFLKVLNQENGYKCDSMIAFKFTSTTDSVLAIKQKLRNNSEGMNYFIDSWEPYWGDRAKWHFNFDELDNDLGHYIKYYWISGDKRYSWAEKAENIYDTSGNIIKSTYYYWDGNWKHNQSWERYYSEEIPKPSLSYDWYDWSGGLRIRDEEGFDYIDPVHDTLFLGDGYEGYGVVTPKIVRKYDEQGFVILSEGYVWSDVDNQWVPYVKEEFVHGPSGLDTLHRGYVWDENEKIWELDFADTLIRDENGNWIDYKMTHWDNDHVKLILWRRLVAEYDSENRLLNLKYYGESSSVTDLMTYREWKYLYDIYGNEIFYSDNSVGNDILKDGYNEYRYYSPLEISTDASLWDVSFEGSGLRQVLNGIYSKTSEIFDDERYEYVILNSGSDIIPPMTYVKNDPNSTVVVTEASDPTSANKEDRSTTITVTAEDGLTTQNYYFDFYKPNGIATLDTIMVSEGKLYPDFSPEIDRYYDTIYGCCDNGVSTPKVTWVKSEPYQYVVLLNASNICDQNNKVTRVTVKSDNGVSTKYYKITFTVVDTISPIAVCKDSIIYLDPTEYVLLDGSDIDDGSIVCGIPMLELDKDSFTIADAGANTITLTVTDEKGKTDQCTSTITIIITGVNAINSSDFIINPNPTSDIMNLEHSSPMIDITVINMLGQKVGEYELNSVMSCEISLAKLNKGVYFIWMRDNRGQIHTRKFIKN